MKYTDVTKALTKAVDKNKAKNLSRFFKTGKGQYGEGDIFLGVVVPEQRKIAKQFSDLSLSEIQRLLKSKIHECRATALFILIIQFEKSREGSVGRKKIVNFYLTNLKYINNWDLVDLSAPKILSVYLLRNNRDILYKFAESKNMWERRVSVLSTYQFIKHNDFKDILALSEKLLGDKHDLMHKAVGWMLREVGKRDEKVLKDFLKKNIKNMPRTALRYAIEKFSENERKIYLKTK